ncbi:MAG: riboflavin synthase [Bacteroidales bacterium]|nr:riboflavin synthase [Bacteroidales bacterium]MBR6091941.1 riboflavin synthase [Bacteroidales bacterium]
MFTGIIEEIGKVKAIVRHANSIMLTIAVKKILDDIHIGDSICTNGVCLTVTTFDEGSYTADVMPETMSRTNFKDLRINDLVNCERAMPANGRFGGHIVSGHIDGTGVISKMSRDDKAIRIKIETRPEILKYIVEKGSITIDGISLTVTEVSNWDFGVSIIEHTQDATTLTKKKVGETVNLENDIIGKYIEKFVGSFSAKKDENLLNLLNDNNFLV